MIKKIGKIFINIIIAFFLIFVFYYFLLIKIPEEYYTQGPGSPVMSKEQALDLMHYHGVKVVWAEDGEWYFRRDGEDCKLTRMEK